MSRVVLALALAIAIAAPAAAQQVSLDIKDGLVTLHASNASVRQVLAEWARVGGTKVVGAERVSGAPVTLSIEGVPESKALDMVLRGAAGFMAASRAVPGSGRSQYDRIMVLATSTPPAGGASPGGQPGGRGTPPRPFGVSPSQPPEVNDTSDTGADSPPVMDPPQTNPFANAFAQPGMAQPFGQPASAPAFGQPIPNPFGQPVGNPFGQPLQQAPPAGGLFTPVQSGVPVAPGLFGGAGSSVPGVVQQPPAAPGQPPRPRPQ